VSQDRPVDVIVPVYRGLETTRACINSVLTAKPSVPFNLMVIDDASPEPSIQTWLDELAAQNAIELHRNADNQGFVRSVNYGMEQHPDRDVVLLNSDTMVYGDWLGRLQRCGYRHADIASVSPFSNNASILSYPQPNCVNPLPADVDGAALDALCAQANAEQAVDIPVAVGFCMWIRRAALNAVGLFDAERFGLGYGEECDWCMRANAQGWRHQLCADAFVYHAGAVSFAEQATERQQAAHAVLLDLHPHYHQQVMAFQTLDPIRPLRRAVDRSRIGEHHAAHTVLAEREQEVDRLQAELARNREHLNLLNTELERTRQAVAERDVGLAKAEGFVREREADIRTVEARLDKTVTQLEQVYAQLHQTEMQLNKTLMHRLRRIVRRLLKS